MLIVGNIIAFVASVLMVYSGILIKKKNILFVQATQNGLSVISNLLLKGISGAIINGLNFVRNILCYNNKLGFWAKLVISILATSLIIYFNNMGFIGYLPLIAMLSYTWYMTTSNIRRFKVLIMFTNLLWAIYDFKISLYTACIFDVLTFLSNLISLSYIKKTK